MKVIIEKLKNGGIGITKPTPEWLQQAFVYASQKDIAPESQEQEVFKWLGAGCVPEGQPFWIMDESILPTDREYRNAWELDGSEGEPDGYGGLKVD